MDNIKYDCIIIGGGISGISFAHYMQAKGKKVLILEKDKNTGGQIQTIFAKQYPDYWREFGAHTCYNSYTHLLSIVKDINGTNLIHSLGKGSYVTYTEGKIKKMFAELSIPALILNGPKIFFASKKGKTVKEYFSTIVGAGNYNRLFSRLFRAVISQNADEYPAELFLKRRKNRYKEFPRKYTFNKGLSQFLNTILEKGNMDVIKSCEITDIQRDTEEYKIIALGGQIFHAKNIAIATDPQTTSRLIKNIEKSLSELLASIPLFHTESINIIVAKDKLAIENIAGIIALEGEFHSAVSRDLVEDEHLRSFTFHFEKGNKTENEKLDIICNVLNISRNDILEWEMIRHILPSLRMSHLNLHEQVNKIRKFDNIYILGNYFYGLSIEDCINRSFDESERFL
ncbi:FAD-dependent oxidoreductase [Dysgonomonas sp. Marseille-P4677]|uniref:FAD-dependent oxidoreductase n=1 Tax=Dysgonomonas sp. Marseille-P4677 TaxID=2364790 RepID=UPI0019116F70|nr:FAD-dependent oxidoreductase [Dysgonomonas sp. Marseille-P4677]MBK5722559.1 FAD-dependent oxidoreductase [Dysgonomonas sp. Marseille-P4677]